MPTHLAHSHPLLVENYRDTVQKSEKQGRKRKKPKGARLFLARHYLTIGSRPKKDTCGVDTGNKGIRALT